MNILETIIAEKEIEVSRQKVLVPLAVLEQSEFFNRKIFSLKEFLLDETKTGIIAEFKRKSPSKGIINDRSDVEIGRAHV